MHSSIRRAAQGLLVLLMPFFLILTSVRLLLTPAFVALEYRTPGFPADPFGFTAEERLDWSAVSLDYLLNDEGIESLAAQRLSAEQPLYNARELQHMSDVKTLVQAALRVWLACAVVVIGLVVVLWWRGEMAALLHGLQGGGRWTLLLMGIVAGGLAVSFSFLFVGFHRIFFQGETWLFLYSDSLIRLFPERFWRDAFLWICGLTAWMAVGLWAGARWGSHQLEDTTSSVR
jgi:integral membrane protein (TIGR01906 family)